MKHGPGLVSVGYEGRSAEDLILALLDSGVEVVVDVRLNPTSRKPGLSKTRLSAALADAGVDYVHLRALGNPRDNRAPFWSNKVAVGVRRFQELLEAPEPAASLDELTALARERRVAVLCFERDHERCHRQVVTDAVAERCESTTVAYA